MAQLTTTDSQTADVLGRVVDLSKVLDSAAVGNVFGQPVTQGDVTVIPVAKVMRGVGGGSGTSAGAGPEGEGAGGGVAVAARPVGVFVIRAGKVSWQPVVHVNRAILGGQLVAVAALLAVRSVVKARIRRRSRA